MANGKLTCNQYEQHYHKHVIDRDTLVKYVNKLWNMSSSKFCMLIVKLFPH